MTEVVEAEGHLIDSQLMNAMFDTVVRHDAAFDVLEFRIGRTNDEPSFVSMRVTAKTPPALTEVLEELVALGCRVARAEDAHLVPADRDGCAPEDFYSTTNHQTSVRLAGQWVQVERQRMDAAIVLDGASYRAKSPNSDGATTPTVPLETVGEFAMELDFTLMFIRIKPSLET